MDREVFACGTAPHHPAPFHPWLAGYGPWRGGLRGRAVHPSGGLDRAVRWEGVTLCTFRVLVGKGQMRRTWSFSVACGGDRWEALQRACGTWEKKLKGRRSTRHPFVGSLAVERRYYRGATSRVKVMG